MHSVWARLNAVFFYSLTILFLLSAGSALTTYWKPATAVVNTVRVHELRAVLAQYENLKAGGRVRRDRAVLSFDVDADLTDVFNWNVKQLFVMLTARFETASNSFNEVVIWDAVVPDRSAARLHANGTMNKYPIIDQRAELRGAPLTLTLKWDVMPTTGLLYLGQGGRYSMQLPTEYCREGQCPPLTSSS